MACSERDQEVAEGFHHPHGLAAHLGVCEQARQIVGRVGATVFDDPVEEHRELQRHRLDGRGPILPGTLEVGVVGREQLVRQTQELGFLLAGDAEDGGQDAQRVCSCDLVGDLTLSLAVRGARDQLIHQVLRALLHDRRDARDRAGSEPVGCGLPVVPMFGRVHPDDRAHLAGALVRLQDPLLFLALEHDSEPVEEPLGLLGDLADLVMPDDGVEGGEALRRAAVQSFLPAQGAPLLVGDATIGVRLGRDEFVPRDVGHAFPHRSVA